jgi:hypothetical protein
MNTQLKNKLDVLFNQSPKKINKNKVYKKFIDFLTSYRGITEMEETKIVVNVAIDKLAQGIFDISDALEYIHLMYREDILVNSNTEKIFSEEDKEFLGEVEFQIEQNRKEKNLGRSYLRFYGSDIASR